MKKGFTIVELIIAMTVILILAGAAVAGSAGLIRSIRFTNAFNKIVFMVQQARSLAVTGKNSAVNDYYMIFDETADPETITLFGDQNNNQTLDTGESIEEYRLETTTNLHLHLESLSPTAVPSCGTLRIGFRNGNGETSLVCGADTPANVKIGVEEEPEGGGPAVRSKNFLLHQAAGIPQVGR
jgi:prepilin-type N-terminal cleavage/methylation domain-containing protein